MAAPSATVRQAPGGIKLRDGLHNKITLGNDPDVSFWEKSSNAPGIEGGDAIDQTTAHNVTWATKCPQDLKELTDVTITAAYDPAVYTQILAQINVNQVITNTFPDGSTLAFWGFVKNFVPGQKVRGQQPEANVTIVPTNVDNSGVEQAPVLVSVAGT